MPRSKNSSGEYRRKYEKVSLLACLVQRLSAFTSRSEHKGGQGALEPPPEDGARTKRFDREFQFREPHTEAETKKTPDRVIKRNEWSYIFVHRASFFLVLGRSVSRVFFNEGAVQLAQNPICTSNSKHIDVRQYLLKEGTCTIPGRV